MNQVMLIGRLTRDVEVNSNASTPTAKFTLAINRGKDRNGRDLGADYPGITCFGKTAELAGKYLSKGRKVAVMGRIQTGTYEKDGRKIYTTEVIADRLEFLGGGNSDNNSNNQEQQTLDYAQLDDSIPF